MSQAYIFTDWHMYPNDLSKGKGLTSVAISVRRGIGMGCDEFSG